MSGEPETETAAAPAEVPRFAGGKARWQKVPLEWPVDYGGRTYDAVFVHRMTADEVNGYIERVNAAAGREAAMAVRFPMYRDAAGEMIPDPVIGALDDDDSERVHEVAQGFLPRRFRAAPDSAPTSGSGAPTSPA